MEEGRPDIVIIHVGSNDITHNTIDNIDAKNILKRIINIGKTSLLYGLIEVIISSIFIKRQFKLTRIITQVNDHYLRDECGSNKFHFISNGNITNECLWADGLHLNNKGTYMFASNLVDFLNGFIFNRNIRLTKDDNTNLGKENSKQGFEVLLKLSKVEKIDCSSNVTNNEKKIELDSNYLSNLRVKNMNKLLTGNLNINSISNKFDQLKLLVRGKVDILVVMETKLDSTFPTPQFLIEGYSEPYRFDRNRNGGGVLIYVREDILSKPLTDHIELNLRKVSGCSLGHITHLANQMSISLIMLKIV